VRFSVNTTVPATPAPLVTANVTCGSAETVAGGGGGGDEVQATGGGDGGGGLAPPPPPPQAAREVSEASRAQRA
jgi:hypothetical protein